MIRTLLAAALIVHLLLGTITVICLVFDVTEIEIVFVTRQDRITVSEIPS